MVEDVEPPQRDAVKPIERKLEKCRNQENNPDSTMWVIGDGSSSFEHFESNWIIFLFSFSYKMRMKKMLDDEDDIDLDGTPYQILNTSAADVSMLSTN